MATMREVRSTHCDLLTTVWSRFEACRADQIELILERRLNEEENGAFSSTSFSFDRTAVALVLFRRLTLRNPRRSESMIGSKTKWLQ